MNRKFVSFIHFLIEITQGDEFGGLTELSDDGDLTNVFIRQPNSSQIFPNDGPNKVVLQINTRETSIDLTYAQQILFTRK